MFRLLIFLAALALAAWGLMWLSDNPGLVTVVWRGVEYKVSLMLALGVVAVAAVALSIVWGVLRFVFNIPSFVTLAARARRREKGLMALSRGMIAVGAGDARAAARHAAEANRLAAHEPMTRLLSAQAAQLAGDREGAVAAYNAMLEHHETHGLGLRGLHLEARRGGDHEAALQYAMRANARAPAAWAGQAVLDDRARRGDWAGALATVDSNASARLIDKPTANRWRAVIKTAMAEETDGTRSEGCASARAGSLPPRPGARSGRGDLRTIDRGCRRLSPGDQNSRKRLCADAASRPRCGLLEGTARRFDRRPARARPLAGARRAKRSRIDADHRTRCARGA